MSDLGWLHQALARATIVLGDLLVGEKWWQFLARIRLDALSLAVTLIFLGHSIAHLAKHAAFALAQLRVRIGYLIVILVH